MSENTTNTSQTEEQDKHVCVLREATYEDLPELMKLGKQFHYASGLKRIALYEEAIESWELFFKAFIGSDQHLMYVAEVKPHGLVGVIAGFVGPMPVLLLHSRVAYESLMWVVPEVRQKGVARKLVAFYEDWAKKQGCSHCSLGAEKFFGWKMQGKFYRSMDYELEEQGYGKRL